MSTLLESPTERFLPEPHFVPFAVPFPEEYWYNGFFDDPVDPEIDGKPIPPMAFRGNPILLAGKPGGVFHEHKEEVFLNYDFEPLNPYRERLTDRDDWALNEAERIWDDVHCITSVFELKTSCCPDLVVLADLIALGIQSIIAELAKEPEALEYFCDKITNAVSSRDSKPASIFPTQPR